MKERYYIYLNKESRGPYSLAQLKEMWRVGNLPANTPICQEGTSEWVELTSIEDRFQEVIKAPSPAIVPMDRYYYSIDGTQVFGPDSLDGIREMYTAGSLNDATKLCKEGQDMWCPIEDMISPHRPASAQLHQPFYSQINALFTARKRVQTNRVAPTKENQQVQAALGCLLVYIKGLGLGLVLIGILIGIVVGVFYFWDQFTGSSSSSSSSFSSTRSEPRSITESDAFSGGADDLYKQYSANEVNADNHYKNHPATVSGNIVDIGKDIMDTPYIIVGDRSVLEGVQCMFDRSNNPVASLTKGQNVRVHGPVKGKMINVILENCSLR